MTFFLAPGETLRWGIRLGFTGLLALLFASSETVRLTDRRLVVTQTTRGNEVTSYIPLEAIVRVRYGRFSSMRLMYTAIVCFILALLALPLTAGIGTVVFGLLGGFFLWLYYGSRREVLGIDNGTDLVYIGIDADSADDLDGNPVARRDQSGTLVAELELARQELVHGDLVRDEVSSEDSDA